MPLGTYRRVILLGRFAVKVPRLRRLASGMRCNRWEREMWRTWRPAFGWENLCPVLLADPLGLALVMPRAAQPVTREEAWAALGDYWPGIDAEAKAENWGSVAGAVLCLDYGLPDVDLVTRRRRYLSAHPARRQ